MLGRIKKWNKYKIAGLILILVGLGFILYIPATWVVGYFEQRSLRGDYAQESADALALNQSILAKLQGAADQDKLRALAVAFRSRLSADQTIGELEIPKIGLDSIVVEGSDDSALHKGPGHLEETPLPGMGGNFVVAGDRVLYGAPFLHLNDIHKGDEIFFHTPYGNFNYTVINHHITQPEDISVLNPDGSDEITLITCDPIWNTTHRLIVQANLTSASMRQS